MKYSLKFGLFFLSLSILLSGCAVTKTNTVFGERVEYGLDLPEIFGKEVARFNLPGGEVGTIRSMAGAYSMKLQKYSRVLDIDDASSVKIAQQEIIGNRAVIVLEVDSPSCALNTRIYSIEGNSISSWRLTNCGQSASRISRDGNMLHVDFDDPRGGQRFTYRDAQLYRSKAPVSAPAPGDRAGGAAVGSAPQPKAATSSSSARGRSPSASSSAASVSAPPRRRDGAKPSELPRVIDYEDKPVKSTVVVLDK